MRLNTSSQPGAVSVRHHHCPDPATKASCPLSSNTSSISLADSGREPVGKKAIHPNNRFAVVVQVTVIVRDLHGINKVLPVIADDICQRGRITPAMSYMM